MFFEIVNCVQILITFNQNRSSNKEKNLQTEKSEKP
jgi:hypothetical protein